MISKLVVACPPGRIGIVVSCSDRSLVAVKLSGPDCAAAGSSIRTAIFATPAAGVLLKTTSGTTNRSPGAANRGQLLCTSIGEQTSTARSADPTPAGEPWRSPGALPL